MNMFEVYWPDFDFRLRARLLPEDNPINCSEFLKMLPFKTIFAASMSAGEMFKVPVPRSFSPLPPEKRVYLPDEKDGTIVVYGTSSILIKYGAIAEPFLCPRLGIIEPSELDRFITVAVKLRDAYFFTKVINVAELHHVSQPPGGLT